MNGLNVERILNGTPTKKLASQYNTLKESFTKENAEKYQGLDTLSQRCSSSDSCHRSSVYQLLLFTRRNF